jgi:hypothetical protein
MSRDDDPVDGLPGAGLPSLQVLIAGLLALQLEDRRKNRDMADSPPAELLLADLGMSIGQIARLTGRNYETVKSTLRRGRERVSKAEPARRGSETKP